MNIVNILLILIQLITTILATDKDVNDHITQLEERLSNIRNNLKNYDADIFQPEDEIEKEIIKKDL